MTTLDLINIYTGIEYIIDGPGCDYGDIIAIDEIGRKLVFNINNVFMKGEVIQFYTKRDNSTLQEWTDKYTDIKKAFNWYNKYGSFWKDKGYKIYVKVFKSGNLIRTVELD